MLIKYHCTVSVLNEGNPTVLYQDLLGEILSPAQNIKLKLLPKNMRSTDCNFSLSFNLRQPNTLKE
jgi:hypothetical protein